MTILQNNTSFRNPISSDYYLSYNKVSNVKATNKIVMKYLIHMSLLKFYLYNIYSSDLSLDIDFAIISV